jgi:hypothetical protein
MSDAPETSETTTDPTTGTTETTTHETTTTTETIGATGDSSQADDPSLEKDPSEWVSGGDPMTASQKSYLDTLAKQAGEELPADLNKAEASEHIERLKPS